MGGAALPQLGLRLGLRLGAAVDSEPFARRFILNIEYLAILFCWAKNNDSLIFCDAILLSFLVRPRLICDHCCYTSATVFCHVHCKQQTNPWSHFFSSLLLRPLPLWQHHSYATFHPPAPVVSMACLTLHHAHATAYNPFVPMYHRVNVPRRHNVLMIHLKAVYGGLIVHGGSILWIANPVPRDHR